MARIRLAGDPEFKAALAKVGQTSEDRARWLLSFAERDVESLTRDERRAVQWEVIAFLLEDTDLKVLMSRRSPHAWPLYRPGRIRQIHKALRAGLEAVRNGRRWPIRTIRDHFLELRDGTLRHWTVRGAWKEDFFDHVYRALREVSRRFRLCPVDQRPFIARKRQAYCRHTCSQTARTRKYRAKHYERLQAARREAYVKKQKKKHGPNVQVGTRKSKVMTSAGSIRRFNSI